MNSVCFTCDHRLVLGADSRQAVRVWDVATGRLKSSLTGAWASCLPQLEARLLACPTLEFIPLCACPLQATWAR